MGQKPWEETWVEWSYEGPKNDPHWKPEGRHGASVCIGFLDDLHRDPAEHECLATMTADTEEQAIARARLAAAAPELYRALEVALGAADAAILQHDVDTSCETESYDLVRKAHQLGDAVLRKARGEP